MSPGTNPGPVKYADGPTRSGAPPGSDRVIRSLAGGSPVAAPSPARHTPHQSSREKTMSAQSLLLTASLVGAGLLVGTATGRYLLRRLALILGIAAALAVLFLDGNSPLSM
jgi:hypothetical protein